MHFTRGNTTRAAHGDGLPTSWRTLRYLLLAFQFYKHLRLVLFTVLLHYKHSDRCSSLLVAIPVTSDNYVYPKTNTPPFPTGITSGPGKLFSMLGLSHCQLSDVPPSDPAGSSSGQASAVV